MSWQKYDLVFRLLAPMHIGWRKTSNLQQTRGYVTGKIVWAALTARLTREAGQGANGQAYRDIGNLVQDKFRFTYLYPAIRNGNGYTIHYPWEDDFDYLFLDSYTSAALNYDNQSTEDGLLHETEYIAPHTRTGQPVYLCGSIYVYETVVAANNTLKNWQTALNKLQFGGERGYGWGQIQLVNTPEGKTIDGEPAGKPVNGRITAHLIAPNNTSVTGSIEPLIGWERTNTDNGEREKWKLSDEAAICYAPGSLVSEQDTLIIIEKNGLWQLRTS